MAICNSCGNEYSNTFKISLNDQTYDFDCFECAINKLAPICQQCGCKIIGHGIESDNFYYCCSHCARHSATNSNAKMTGPLIC